MRGKAIGLDAEFLDRIGERKREIDVGETVVVISAVHDVVVPGGLASTDGDSRGAGVVFGGDDGLRAAEGCCGNAHGAAGEQDEVGGLASVEG